MNNNLFDTSSDNPSYEFEPINTAMSEQINRDFENYAGGLLMGGGENILNVMYEQSGGLFGMGNNKTVPATTQTQPVAKNAPEKMSRSTIRSEIRSGSPSELIGTRAGEVELEGYSTTKPALVLMGKSGPDLGTGNPRNGDIFHAKSVFKQTNKGSVVMSLTSSQLHQHMITAEKLGIPMGMKLDTNDSVYQARLKQLLMSIDNPYWKTIKLFNMEQVIPSKATTCKLIIYEEQFNELNNKLSEEYRLREQKILNLLYQLYSDIKEELRGPYESIKKIAMRVLGENVENVVNTHGEQITNKIGLTNARLYIQEQLDLIKDASKLNKYTRRRRWISKHYNDLMNAPIPRDQRANDLFNKQPPPFDNKETTEESKEDPRTDDEPVGMGGKPPETIETLKILLLHDSTYVTSELHNVYFKKGKLFSLQTKKSISLNDICVWINSGENVVSLTPNKLQFSDQTHVVERINKLRETTPYVPPVENDIPRQTLQKGGKLTEQQKLEKIRNRQIKKIKR